MYDCSTEPVEALISLIVLESGILHLDTNASSKAKNLSMSGKVTHIAQCTNVLKVSLDGSGESAQAVGDGCLNFLRTERSFTWIQH